MLHAMRLVFAIGLVRVAAGDEPLSIIVGGWDPASEFDDVIRIGAALSLDCCSANVHGPCQRPWAYSQTGLSKSYIFI